MGKPVRVLRFGVEDSLDVTAYQRLKTKGAIADSIMNGKKMIENSMENRALEEEEDVFGDTVAQLSGSEYAMLKNQAEKDVRKYEAKRKQYEADQKYCHSEIPRLKKEIEALKDRLEMNRKNLDKVKGISSPVIVINKQQYADVEATADFLKDFNKKIREAENELRDNPSIQTQERKLTVNVGGIDFEFTTELTIDMIQNQGQLFTAVRRKMTYSCPTLNLSDVPVKQALLREGLEDIIKNVVTGNDFRERIEVAERKLAKD
jgi:predicted RNase H-like nuclease (RuvC/YqgF family)